MDFKIILAFWLYTSLVDFTASGCGMMSQFSTQEALGCGIASTHRMDAAGTSTTDSWFSFLVAFIFSMTKLHTMIALY